jgi:hypothetical protein
MTTDFEEETYESAPIEEPIDDGYRIIEESYIIDDYGYRMGDTIYIDYYNDGYIEKYYTDGEMYED